VRRHDRDCAVLRFRRRSRRLRKKLRVGEFRELGFAVGFRVSPALSSQEVDELWNRFILDAIEARGLAFCGGHEGFVTKVGRGSATEADRDAVRAWLAAQRGVEDVKVGPLEDAWHESAGPSARA